MKFCLRRDKYTQSGVIVFGAGMNHLHYIKKAKADGYTVLLCSGYAELYRLKESK